MRILYLTGSKKQITKVLKNLIGLYYSYSHEVVSVLLDFLMKAIKSSDLVELPVDAQDVPNMDTLLNEWKLVIIKFSNKEPDLLQTLLKAVLEMIEAQEAMKYEMGNYQCNLSVTIFLDITLGLNSNILQ